MVPIFALFFYINSCLVYLRFRLRSPAKDPGKYLLCCNLITRILLWLLLRQSTSLEHLGWFITETIVVCQKSLSKGCLHLGFTNNFFNGKGLGFIKSQCSIVVAVSGRNCHLKVLPELALRLGPCRGGRLQQVASFHTAFLTVATNIGTAKFLYSFEKLRILLIICVQETVDNILTVLSGCRSSWLFTWFLIIWFYQLMLGAINIQRLLFVQGGCRM